MNEQAFISEETDAREWHWMWSNVPDKDKPCEHGESWQYMGTERNFITNRWEHVFRHRCTPQTGERRYLRIEATRGWAPPAR